MGQQKQIILHIGRAKSGTSALQAYLVHQREALAANGICYPHAGCNGEPAHHKIARLCRDAPPGDAALGAARDAFEAEIAPFDTVIVSSEAFQNVRAPSNLSFFFRRPKQSLLHRLTGLGGPFPYRIKVICYIREFLEFASSSYAQKVHANDYADTLEGYCRSHFRRPLQSIVDLWTAFGDEAHFRNYERSKLLGHDIVEDFFATAGLSAPGPSSSYDANPSISGNLLAFKLLLNCHGCHTMELYEVLSDIARQDARYRGKIFIGDQHAQILRSQDGGYNAQLTQLVGPISRRSFETGNRFDPAQWTADLERFLTHPALAHLREKPEIARAQARDAAALAEGAG